MRQLTTAVAIALAAAAPAGLAQAPAVPTGPLRVVLSVDSAVAAFKETIGQIIRFEIEQQVAVGTLAVELELLDGGQRPADDDGAANHEPAMVADAFASRVPFLLLFDVRGTTDAVAMEATWYDVDAAARVTATRSGRIGLDLDGVVVATLRELWDAPAARQEVVTELVEQRRRESRTLVLIGRYGLLSVVGGLGGDVLPTTTPAASIGLQLDLRDARLTIGAEVSYFPVITTGGGGGGPTFILPVMAEARYAFGAPLELYARAGLGVAFVPGGATETGVPGVLPGITVGVGGSLAVAGTARAALDFGVLAAVAGDQGLFFGVRPSLGLSLAFPAGG